LTQKVNEICNTKFAIPSIDLIIIPTTHSSVYENVIRAAVPRNVTPENIFVSKYNLSNTDLNFLNKLDRIRLVPQSTSLLSSIFVALSRSKADNIVLIDGHVKVLQTILRKILAALLEKPQAVYYCGCKRICK
jgi:hypothetical protein